jgi:hypothetical protein
VPRHSGGAEKEKTMLNELVQHIPTADQSLRSLGLMRISQTHGGGRTLLAFTLGAVLGIACALLIGSLPERALHADEPDTGVGRGAEMHKH